MTPTGETTEPDNLYPIRPELIETYVKDNRPDLLISLFNSLKAQRDRAERVATIWQTEVQRLTACLEGQGQTTSWSKPPAPSARGQAEKRGTPKEKTPEPDLALDI